MNWAMFGQVAGNERVIGEVVGSPLPDWWIIEDAQGKKYRAASINSWALGDRVVVISGQIIERAGKVPVPEVYQV